MYLNDLHSATHGVEKLNKILSSTYGHEINLAEMSMPSLRKMLGTTETKLQRIRESDSAYWDNRQFNKLKLIQEQLEIYITEVAPCRKDKKKMKKRKIREGADTDLESAEVLLAAQEIVDKLQGIIEDLAKMQVQELMPIVDSMKEHVGFDIAEQYSSAAETALGDLLDQAKMAKDSLENATLAAQGKPVNQSPETDMGMGMDAEMGPPEGEMMGDEFGGDEAMAGAENTVGRELKTESFSRMERQANAQLRVLEAKRKVLEAAKNGKIPTSELKKIIRRL